MIITSTEKSLEKILYNVQQCLFLRGGVRVRDNFSFLLYTALSTFHFLIHFYCFILYTTLLC